MKPLALQQSNNQAEEVTLVVGGDGEATFSAAECRSVD